MQNSQIDALYQKASQLSDNEQLQLISKLASSLQKARKKEGHKLSELQGLGKDLWKDVDIENYVKSLREDWNG